MIRTVLAATAVALTVSLVASLAHAGPIQNACNRSDRRAANPSVCACIQQAADMTLRSSEQRRAAKFFADPDEAQRVRLSDTPRDDEFWERYRNFGSTAEAVCG
jgi:hypothetical protein